MTELRHKLFVFTHRSKLLSLLPKVIRQIIYGNIVGVLMGVVAALFLGSLQAVTNTRIKYPWLIYMLPLGGAFVSFLYVKYGKASVEGTNLILSQVNEGDKEVPLRMAPLVFMGTIITHLFGGSAGRVGAGVQMGGSIADYLGKLLKLNKEDKRLLIICGISSALGTLLGTPLAGTVFGMEVIALGSLEYKAFFPCLAASFSGNFVAKVLGTSYCHYIIKSIPEVTVITMVKVIISGILFGLLSILFSEGINSAKKMFPRIFKNRVIRTAVGGILIIVITGLIGSKDYLGLGLPIIDRAFENSTSMGDSLWKIIFTSLTLGSGFQSGEVTPALFVGSTFGNALGEVMNISPSLLAALGLVSVFCGATNAPIAAMLLGIELFQGKAIGYLIIAVLISYLVSGKHSIYAAQKKGNGKLYLLKVLKNKYIMSINEKKNEGDFKL